MSGRENVRAGLLGEWQALRYLRHKGYRLLAWRYRAAGGEVDLVLRDCDVLVFAEVKYRPDGHIGDGARAVDADKRRRLRLAAGHYLARHGGVQARFDVVEITRAGIRHIQNAF